MLSRECLICSFRFFFPVHKIANNAVLTDPVQFNSPTLKCQNDLIDFLYACYWSCWSNNTVFFHLFDIIFNQNVITDRLLMYSRHLQSFSPHKATRFLQSIANSHSDLFPSNQQLMNRTKSHSPFFFFSQIAIGKKISHSTGLKISTFNIILKKVPGKKESDLNELFL